MIRFILLAFLATLPCLAGARLAITVEDVSGQFPGVPRVQSFSFAQWKGRWVIVGGRAAGYHGVGGSEADFLRLHANREIWVIDTNVKPVRTYHASLDTLPASLLAAKDQLGSTAQLSVQDGPDLYVAGGYGQNHEGDWDTFPVITKIDLPLLIAGVMNGKVPPASLTFAVTPLVQVSGGELLKLPDGYFYLAMGHVFHGSYTAFEGQKPGAKPAASQEYLNEIRKLKIATSKTTGLTVSLVQAFKNEKEFHRRDLNIVETMSPKGMGLAAFGGVFTPDTQLAYTKPVYLFANEAPAVDQSFEQKMNAYTCPLLLIYDAQAETMYTSFFGGISRYVWQGEPQGFVENPRTGTRSDPTYRDGMQWSDQVSTIQRIMSAGKEKTLEYVQTQPLPGFLGTNAVFIPLPAIPRAHPGSEILAMDSLRNKRTLVGHVFGGIRASPFQFPYSKQSTPYNSGAVPTKPSDLVLAVYVEAAP